MNKSITLEYPLFDYIPDKLKLQLRIPLYNKDGACLSYYDYGATTPRPGRIITMNYAWHITLDMAVKPTVDNPKTTMRLRITKSDIIDFKKFIFRFINDYNTKAFYNEKGGIKDMYNDKPLFNLTSTFNSYAFYIMRHKSLEEGVPPKDMITVVSNTNQRGNLSIRIIEGIIDTLGTIRELNTLTLDTVRTYHAITGAVDDKGKK